jgi:protein-S-isoprenylcysteine O-methyltransferase Ste14
MDSVRIVPRLVTSRIRHTRWLVIALLPLVVLIAPPRRAEWAADLMEGLGVLCLVACLVGRGWTSLYVAGRKNTELVTLGPYSVVRNPLYVFSFIGLVGVGLISEVLSLLALGVACFAAYYPAVVRREEAHMARLHGDAYQRYSAAVPRWFPDFGKWRDADRLEIDPRLVFSHLLDSSLFFLSFMLFETIEVLRSANLIPVLLTMP